MTKTDLIRDHLIEHGSITPWEAITKYHATRLSDTIFRMKKIGYVIDTEIINGQDSNGNPTKYARYTLVSKP